MDRLEVVMIAGLSILLWGLALVQDLEAREISLFVLVCAITIALVGQPWPWWAVSVVTLAWPVKARRRSVTLVPLAIVTGAITGDPVPGIALAAGAAAWALGWWGGADGILLLALGLRHGAAGVIAGASSLVLLGLALTVARQRLWALAMAIPDVFSMKVWDLDAEVPAEREMPAAAALGGAGLILEVIRLWQMM